MDDRETPQPQPQRKHAQTDHDRVIEPPAEENEGSIPAPHVVRVPGTNTPDVSHVDIP